MPLMCSTEEPLSRSASQHTAAARSVCRARLHDAPSPAPDSPPGLEAAPGAAHRHLWDLRGGSGIAPRATTALCASHTRRHVRGVCRCIALMVFAVLLLDALRDAHFARSPLLYAHAAQYDLRMVYQLEDYTDGVCVSGESVNLNSALSPVAKTAAPVAAVAAHSVTPAVNTLTVMRINITACSYYPLWSLLAGVTAASGATMASDKAAPVDTAIDVGGATAAAAAIPVLDSPLSQEGATLTEAAAASSNSDAESGVLPSDGLSDEVRAALQGPRWAVTYYYMNVITSEFFYLVPGGTITVTIGTDVAPSYASTLLHRYAADYTLDMSQTGSDGTFHTSPYSEPKQNAVPSSSASRSSGRSDGGDGPTPSFPYPDLTLPTAYFFWNQPRLHCLYNAPALMSRLVDSVNQQAATPQQRRLFAQSPAPSQSLLEQLSATAAAAPSYPSCAAHMPSPNGLLPPVNDETLLGVPYMQLDSTLVVKIFTFDVWYELTNAPIPYAWTTAPVVDGDSSTGSARGGGGSSGAATAAHDTATSRSYTAKFDSSTVRSGEADPLNLAADPLRVCAAPALYTIPINNLLADAASWTLGSADEWLQSSASVNHSYPPERVVAVVVQCSGMPMSFSITVSLVNPGSYAGSGQHYDTSIMYFLFLVCYALLLVIFLMLIVPCSKRRHRSLTPSAQPLQSQQVPDGSAGREGPAERRTRESSMDGDGRRDADKRSSSRPPRESNEKTTGSAKGASRKSGKRKSGHGPSAVAASGASAASAELSASSQRSAAARIEVSRPLDNNRGAQAGAADSEPDTSSLYTVHSSASTCSSSRSSNSSLDGEANTRSGRATMAAGSSVTTAAAAAGGRARSHLGSASSSFTITSTSSSSDSPSSSRSSDSRNSRSSSEEDDDVDGGTEAARRWRRQEQQNQHRGARQCPQRSRGRGSASTRRDREAAAARYAADLDDDDDDSDDNSLDRASRSSSVDAPRRRRTSRRGRNRHSRGSHRYVAAASAQAARAQGTTSACFSAASWRRAARRLRGTLTRRVLDPLSLWWKESHILIMYAPVQWIVLFLIALKCLLCILHAAQYSLLAGMQLDVTSIGYSLPLVGFIVEVAASTLLIPTEMLISMGYGLAYTSPLPTNHIVLVCIATPAMFVVYILCVTCDSGGVNMALTKNVNAQAANRPRCTSFTYTRISLEMLCRLHNVLRMMLLVSYLSRTIVPADAAAVQRQRRLRLRQQRREQREGTAAAATEGQGASRRRETARGDSRDASRRQHQHRSRSASAYSSLSSSSSSSSLTSSSSSRNSSLNSRTVLQLGRSGLLLPSNPALTSAGAPGGAMYRAPLTTLSPPPRLHYPDVTLSAMEVYLRYHGMWKPFAMLLVWSILCVCLCFCLYEPEDYYMIVAWQEVQTVYLLGFILSYLRTASPFYC